LLGVPLKEGQRLVGPRVEGATVLLERVAPEVSLREAIPLVVLVVNTGVHGLLLGKAGGVGGLVDCESTIVAGTHEVVAVTIAVVDVHLQASAASSLLKASVNLVVVRDPSGAL